MNNSFMLQWDLYQNTFILDLSLYSVGLRLGYIYYGYTKTSMLQWAYANITSNFVGLA